MTTWPGFIPNTDIDQDSPITQPLMTALRDGPLAIAEADTSVPLDLLPSVKLGTITTTSGTAQSLTSLDLTPFRFLKLVWEAVSHSDAITSRHFTFMGQQATGDVTGGSFVVGITLVEVETGIGFSAVNQSGGATSAYIHDTSITSATTTVTVGVSSQNFDSGSIDVYGVK